MSPRMKRRTRRDDGDEFDPWHPTLSQRLVVNPSTETVDVTVVARSDTVLVAGASDGSVAAWDAATFAVLWRGSVGASVQAISLAAGRRSCTCPLAWARRRRRSLYHHLADFRTASPSRRRRGKPIGGANCRRLRHARVWDGSVQQGVPSLQRGDGRERVRARARDPEAAPRGRLRPEPARLGPFL